MIQKELAAWYAENKRDLPFRGIRDPYRLWVAEVIFQQTRIHQGINYYHRFLEIFPGVEQLAAASEQEVLRIWQGLGYYSRARNMHQAARDLVNRGTGFPRTMQGWQEIKGVGPYTAAAIVSQAFSIPEPAVDGNVFRFLARYYGIWHTRNSAAGYRKAREKARTLLTGASPGTGNQQLIEFGALQCVAGKPDCQECPLKDSCYALNHDLVGQLPVPKQPQKIKTRYFHYLLIGRGKELLLQERRRKDIWKGLWQFPLAESNHPLPAEDVTKHAFYLLGHRNVRPAGSSGIIKHRLTHQDIRIRFFYFLTDTPLPENRCRAVSIPDIMQYPLPVPLLRILKHPDLPFAVE